MGFEAAKEKALATLEEVKVTREMDRETLLSVAQTSLMTKVHKELADLLTEVRTGNAETDLNRILFLCVKGLSISNHFVICACVFRL